MKQASSGNPNSVRLIDRERLAMDGGWILAAHSFLKQEGAEIEVINDEDGA